MSSYPKKAKFSYLLSTSELNSTANGIVSEYNNTEQSVKLRCWCGEQLVEKFRNIYNFNIPNLDLAQENIGDIKTITLLLNQSKEFYWIAEEISSQGSPYRAIIFSASSNFSGSKLTLQEWKDYFVEYQLEWSKLEIVDTFKFDFQPDRMKNPCHYIFNCKNPVNDLVYGHGAVLLYNKELVMQTPKPGLDFTLSQPHDWVPILSAINHFNETPWLAWRTAFREVIKLQHYTQTVENRYRLKKWCSLGKGKNSEWAYKGAIDAQEYYTINENDYKQLQWSYNFDWLKQYYERKYNTVC